MCVWPNIAASIEEEAVELERVDFSKWGVLNQEVLPELDTQVVATTRKRKQMPYNCAMQFAKKEKYDWLYMVSMVYNYPFLNLVMLVSCLVYKVSVYTSCILCQQC